MWPRPETPELDLLVRDSVPSGFSYNFEPKDQKLVKNMNYGFNLVRWHGEIWLEIYRPTSIVRGRHGEANMKASAVGTGRQASVEV